ncbi:hypothetical protein GAYE_SCF63G6630 [Galdieria yellowstonensis]|uniref:60S ribosomal protein L18a n=1 Tax=Galdieria yellowstonensis TaxID=3028027 RepID=A0AAV9IMC6_9RHOD|nr:hypothetical protein GAYE_SCF63G6630 [Galdieria yellowstonensis]
MKGWLHQYSIVGRKIPTEEEPEPPTYRLKIFAPNQVNAKSRFWYFLRKLKRVKKSSGEILNISEVFERKPTQVKNYGIWIRYKSRSDTINMYREYRDVTITGAVEQMYKDMSGRHRARWSSIWVLKAMPVAAKDCRRPKITQFHDSKIKFALPHQCPRASKRKYQTPFKAKRPTTIVQ